MQTVSLSIPYLVLSTEQHMDGKREIHTRTPFGYIDISVIMLDGPQHNPILKVSAEGDFAPWMLDHQMPPAFTNTLFKFIGKIALLHSGWLARKFCRLVISFEGASGSYTISGYLNMADFLREPDTEAPGLTFHTPCA